MEVVNETRSLDALPAIYALVTRIDGRSETDWTPTGHRRGPAVAPDSPDVNAARLRDDYDSGASHPDRDQPDQFNRDSARGTRPGTSGSMSGKTVSEKQSIGSAFQRRRHPARRQFLRVDQPLRQTNPPRVRGHG